MALWSVILVSFVGGVNAAEIRQAAELFSAVSTIPKKIELQWLPGVGNGLKYEVHVGTRKAFQPDATTLKKVTDKDHALIGGLRPGKRYWIKIVTVSPNGERRTSRALDVRTSSKDPKLLPSVRVTSAGAVGAKRLSSTLYKTPASVQKDTVIVGSSPDEAPQLVTKVLAQGTGGYQVQTRPAAPGEVYENLEFSTSFLLANPDKVTSSQSKRLAGSSTTLRKNLYRWQNGASLELTRPASSTNTRRLTSVSDPIEVEQEYYQVRVPHGLYEVELGQTLKEKIQVEKKKDHIISWFFQDDEKERKCTEVGGTYIKAPSVTDTYNCVNIPVKICEASAEVSVPKGLSKSNQPSLVTQGDKYFLQWTPNEKNVDYEHGNPYTVDLIYKVGIGDCRGSDEWNKNDIETIKVEGIKLSAGKLPSTITLYQDKLTWSNKAKTVSYSDDLLVTTTPKVNLEGVFQDRDLDWGRATLQVDLSVQRVRELIMEKKWKGNAGPFPLFSMMFVRAAAAGPVPLIFVGHFRLMAVLETQADAKVEIKEESKATIAVKLGVEYKDDHWGPIKEGDFTYQIKAGATGEATGTLTLRLIPDFSMSLNGLAAVHFLAEPYLYGTVGVRGTIEAGIGDEGGYADADAHFTEIEGGGGMDLRLYAGAAWSTKIKWLKWPTDATYASISEYDFYHQNDRLLKYYSTTRSYKLFTPIPKTALAKLPKLTLKADYMARPSYRLGSRAVKIKGTYKEYTNPIYEKFGVGAKHIIGFGGWDGAQAIERNAQIEKGKKSGEYWVIPKLNDGGRQGDVRLRLHAHTDWGRWSHQVVEETLEVGNWMEPFPWYWSVRYSTQAGKRLTRNGDIDKDGLSNLEEFRHSTFPDRYDSDGDGMSDGCEIHASLDPLDPSDAQGDLDGDGVSNLKECLAGTRPDDPQEYPDPSRNAAPVANAGADRTVLKGKAVLLNGSKSTDDKKIVSYLWKDDDENILCKKARCIVHPTHTTVYTLVVKDKEGLSDSDQVRIQVLDQKNQKPVADAGKDRKIQPGKALLLDGSGSYDPDGRIVSYRWIDDAGNQLCSRQEKTKGSGVVWSKCRITPRQTTTYTLEVVDDQGALSSDQTVVVIREPRKSYRLHLQKENLPDGTKVDPLQSDSLAKWWRLRMSTTHDALLRLKKDLDYPCTLSLKPKGNSQSKVSAKAGKSFEFALEYQTPLEAGKYECSYNIYDQNDTLYWVDGSSRIWIKVKVEDKPLQVIASLAREMITLQEKATVLIDIRKGTSPYSIRLEWGDGEVEELESEKKIISLRHRYAREGSYTPKLTVVDRRGKEFVQQLPLKVIDSQERTSSWRGWLDVLAPDGSNTLTSQEIQVQKRTYNQQEMGIYTLEYHPKEGEVYYTGFRLAVPPGVLSTEHKLRISYLTRAGEIPAYDRELWITTDRKKYGAVILNGAAAPTGSGLFIAKDTRRGYQKRIPSSELVDAALGGEMSLYALELDGGGITVQQGSDYHPIYRYDEDPGESIGEFHLDFRGGGSVELVYLQYDLNDDGDYDDENETMILNTPSKVVDWSQFVSLDAEDNETNSSGSIVIENLSEINSTIKSPDTWDFHQTIILNKKAKFEIVPGKDSDYFESPIGDETTKYFSINFRSSKKVFYPDFADANKDNIFEVDIKITDPDTNEYTVVTLKFELTKFIMDKPVIVDTDMDINQSYDPISEPEDREKYLDARQLVITNGANVHFSSGAGGLLIYVDEGSQLTLDTGGGGYVIFVKSGATLHNIDNISHTVLYESGAVIDGNYSEKIEVSNVDEYVEIKTSTMPVTSALKKTGQTKSYDQEGNEVERCAVKDDGCYQAGVTPRYSRDNAAGIVTDHVTGLQWQDDADPVSKPWLTAENYNKCEDGDEVACSDTSGDTAATYCEHLTLGGYDDWRLPEAKELDSIVDYGRYTPAIDPIFEHTELGEYWSRATYARSLYYAWYVDFDYGSRNYYSKDLYSYVRCVRNTNE